MRGTPSEPNGSAIAAIISASLGVLTLGIVALTTELSTFAKDAVFNLGKAWIPGAEGIGPYSGKETILLIAWLGSWGILHLLLRHRQVPVRLAFGLALGAIGLAILLVWPPVWHLLGA